MNMAFDLAEQMILKAESNMPKKNDETLLKEVYDSRDAEKNIIIKRLENIREYINDKPINDPEIFINNVLIDTINFIKSEF